MANKKIKKTAKTASKRISITESIDYDNLPPIFSLERVQNGDYCFSVLGQEDKAQFAEAIFKRKDLTWNQINSSGRHGLGHEQLPKNQIKAPNPRNVTHDREHYMVFRFNGMKPMVGYRINQIFYVLWFDHNMTLYNHG